MIANDTPTLAFARKGAEEGEAMILHLAFRTALEVGPGGVDNFQEFELDFVGIRNRVELAAVFEEPAAVLHRPLGFMQGPVTLQLREVRNPIRTLVRHWLVHFFGLEKNGISHRKKGRLVGREAFAKFRLALLSAPERCPCLIRHHSVAAAIGKLLCLEGMPDPSRGLQAFHRHDAVAVTVRLLNIDVEENREVRLGHAFFEKDRAALGIVVEAAIDGLRAQGAPEFIHDPTFARIGIMPRKRSASDVLADFARGITAENGTVLDECDLEAAPGARERRAETGDAAPYDAEIDLMGLCGFPKLAGLCFGEIDRRGIHRYFTETAATLRLIKSMDSKSAPGSSARRPILPGAI